MLRSPPCHPDKSHSLTAIRKIVGAVSPPCHPVKIPPLVLDRNTVNSARIFAGSGAAYLRAQLFPCINYCEKIFKAFYKRFGSRPGCSRPRKNPRDASSVSVEDKGRDFDGVTEKGRVRFVEVTIGLLFLFLPLCARASPIVISDIHFMEAQDVSRLVITASAPIEPHIFALGNPDRLVLDFKGAQLGVSLKSVLIANHHITSIRSGRPSSDVWRLVIDLDCPPHYEKIPTSSSLKTVVEMSLPVTAPVVSKETAMDSPHAFVVMIDPGHGGKDTGAIGPDGVTEKKVVLSVAKKLAALINQQPHMRAVLTRNNDHYVTLHNRLVMARLNKADIFLSIHADSYFNDKASGASVYALSKNGATSIAARWLANAKNYSQLEGVPLSALEDQSVALRSVLIDLAKTSTEKDSLQLGNGLLKSLDHIVALHDPRVEQAPFMVLKSPDIPSVLVETGFISNTEDESHLRDPVYQHRIAQALLKGVCAYQKKCAIMNV